jgi:hypothetical protein
MTGEDLSVVKRCTKALAGRRESKCNPRWSEKSTRRLGVAGENRGRYQLLCGCIAVAEYHWRAAAF